MVGTGIIPLDPVTVSLSPSPSHWATRRVYTKQFRTHGWLESPTGVCLSIAIQSTWALSSHARVLVSVVGNKQGSVLRKPAAKPLLTLALYVYLEAEARAPVGKARSFDRSTHKHGLVQLKQLRCSVALWILYYSRILTYCSGIGIGDPPIIVAWRL